MSLISSNGAKTVASDRNFKEKILAQQIESLRDIHNQSFEAFDKIVLTLKKMIQYKNEHLDTQRNQIDIHNHFLQNLSNMEQSFLSLIECLEADQELFKCTGIFRDTEKKLENEVFRLKMKSYEDFKDKLNRHIHGLERDVQLLETNGFHIYSTTQNQNNVLNALKKYNLEKYMTAVTQMDAVLKFVKKKLNQPQGTFVKKDKVCTENMKSKNQQCIRVLKNVYWKEQAHYRTMLQELQKVKKSTAKEFQKLKISEAAMRKNKETLQSLQTEMAIYDENQELQIQSLKFYLQKMKEKVERNYTLTPHLFKNVKGRSKSCFTVLMRSQRGHMRSGRLLPTQQQVNILGIDFLQESLYI